ncbi:transporter substrate-binding domain-containing protein [Pseudoalteromonas fenneropenaei]|uniref:Transporter substrate-binding domain-containing protein n=1 Tax=Pseudoalteromonas fenneropenaei TaxID=1737459 RepID=A0ABV7CLM8_9GAMM
MKRYLTWLTLLMLLCGWQLTQANNLDNAAPVLKYSLSGSGNYFPYYTHDPVHPGIFPDSISAILAAAALKGENLVLPAKRTVYYLESGQLDFDVLSPDWLSETQRQNKLFVFSEPFLAINEYVVTRPDFNRNHQPLLAGQVVGTVRGYYYHDDAEFERQDFNSERELMQALHIGRVDRIIIGDLPALYWSQELGIPFQYSALHSKGELHIRLLAKHQNLLPQLNTAIKELKASGTFIAIEKQYVSSLEKLPTVINGQ